MTSPACAHCCHVRRSSASSVNDSLEREWNEGKHNELLAHPASAGHGLNLQYGPGHTIVFFSLTWSLELFKQFISRLGEARAQRKVMVHLVIAEDTVDEAILIALKNKANGQKDLMQALNEYRARKENIARGRTLTGRQHDQMMAREIAMAEEFEEHDDLIG
jgi:SNF2 family DNA or RNA helicase